MNVENTNKDNTTVKGTLILTHEVLFFNDCLNLPPLMEVGRKCTKSKRERRWVFSNLCGLHANLNKCTYMYLSNYFLYRSKKPFSALETFSRIARII